jgi:hypothetical protein
MATVASGGPFSLFPGVDRILTVLEGELSLSIDGAARLTLDLQTPPLAFAGDVPVLAQTPTQPVTDLNVMTRRGRADAVVRRLEGQTPADIGRGDWALILAYVGDVELTVDGTGYELGKGDGALVSSAATITIDKLRDGVVMTVSLSRT